MTRKWITLAASLSLALGMGLSATAFSSFEDEPTTELGKIMEKVQKQKAVLTKGCRNKAAYAKARDNVKDAAEQWVKFAEEVKPHNQTAKDAKDVPDAEKKWDEFCDNWHKEAKKLAELVAKDETTQKEAKDQLNTVNKTCTECHQVFRIDADDDDF